MPAAAMAGGNVGSRTGEYEAFTLGPSSRQVFTLSRSSCPGTDSDSSEEVSGGGSSCWESAHHLLESHFWSALVMCAIAANTLMMAVQCDYPDWSKWYIPEDAFLIFFIFEMSLRLYVHRLRFFTDSHELAWNLFDLCVVAAGVLDVVLTSLLASGEEGGQVMVIFRIVRIVRIMRSCRLLKHFKQLYLLVQGFLHSMQAVFWIGILFFLVVLIAGIVVTSLVGENAEDWASGPSGDPADAEEIEAKFGTLVRSMITMFQLVTLDNWGDINSLVAKKMPVMTIFFIIYILATAFAMIALLTGVITEHVTSVSRDSVVADEEERFEAYVETLEDVFRKAESEDGEGGLTFEELCRLLRDPQVAEKMELHGNDTNNEIDDLREIFKAMDVSGDGRVSWMEFRHGLKEMQGQASAKEVALLRADMSQLQQLVKDIAGNAPGRPGADMGPRILSLEGQVKRLEASVHGLLCMLGAQGG